MNKTFWQIWGIPIILALLSIFGLLAALLGIGIWHWLSWTALAIPVIVIGWFSKVSGGKANK